MAKKRFKGVGASAPVLAADEIMTAFDSIKIKMLPIDDVVADETIQVRLEGLDRQILENYTGVVAAGGEFPPVIVYETEDGLLLADGFHRLEAHKRAGKDKIQAEVREGTRLDALEYAEECNLKHGLGLSNKSRKRVFFQRMMRGHEWVGLSNPMLADAVGVSESTIRNWLKELSTSQNCEVDRSKVRGKDGKVRDVSGIGAKSGQSGGQGGNGSSGSGGERSATGDRYLPKGADQNRYKFEGEWLHGWEVVTAESHEFWAINDTTLNRFVRMREEQGWRIKEREMVGHSQRRFAYVQMILPHQGLPGERFERFADGTPAVQRPLLTGREAIERKLVALDDEIAQLREDVARYRGGVEINPIAAKLKIKEQERDELLQLHGRSWAHEARMGEVPGSGSPNMEPGDNGLDDGRWVDPETGEIFDDDEIPPGQPIPRPSDVIERKRLAEQQRVFEARKRLLAKLPPACRNIDRAMRENSAFLPSQEKLNAMAPDTLHEMYDWIREMATPLQDLWERVEMALDR